MIFDHLFEDGWLKHPYPVDNQKIWQYARIGLEESIAATVLYQDLRLMQGTSRHQAPRLLIAYKLLPGRYRTLFETSHVDPGE